MSRTLTGLFTFAVLLFFSRAAAFANVKSSALVAKALGLESSGKSVQAKGMLQEAIKADPKDGEPHYHLGSLLLRAGETELAVAEFRAAQKTGYEARTALGAALLKGSQAAEAKIVLSQAVVATPRDMQARFLLGQSKLQTGMPKEAAVDFRAAQKDLSLADRAVFYEGLALLRAGDPDAAKPLLQRAAAGEGETAVLAKTVLDKITPKEWSVRASLSHQIDTNVILAQTNRAVADSSFTPYVVSRKSGGRAVLGAGAAYEHAFSPTFKLGAGYDLYQSMHDSHREILQRFDVSAHRLSGRTVWARGNSRISGTAGVNLSILGPLAAARDYQRGQPKAGEFSRGADGSVGYFFSINPKNVLGIQYSLATDLYKNRGKAVMVGSQPIGSDRSGLTHTGDLLYVLQFGAGYLLTPSAGFVFCDPHGGKNSWDCRGARLGARAGVPLFADFRGDLNVQASARAYPTGFPAAASSGLTLEKRNDRSLDAGANILWAKGMFRANAGATWQRNLSNMNLFDYTRAVYTLGVGIER